MNSAIPVGERAVQVITVKQKTLRRYALITRFTTAAPGVLFLYWCLEGIAGLMGCNVIPAGSPHARFFLLIVLGIGCLSVLALTCRVPGHGMGILYVPDEMLDGNSRGTMVQMPMDAAVQLAVNVIADDAGAHAGIGLLVDNGQSKCYIVGTLRPPKGLPRGVRVATQAVARPPRDFCRVVAIKRFGSWGPRYFLGDGVVAGSLGVVCYQLLSNISGAVEQAIFSGLAFLAWEASVAWYRRSGPVDVVLSAFLRRAGDAVLAGASQAIDGTGSGLASPPRES
jgi:hypothetical protein